MKRTGQDSLQSWLIVLYCSIIAMLLYGVVRLAGIMFVASMELFEVDRQAASFPYVLCDAIQAMSGPLTGFLSLKFGARPVMTAGSFIAAAGIGLCFFAKNIETVTVLWGVCYGVGFGLSSLLLPTVVTQHFVKRRATAISMMYFGSYVGFSFLPSIAEFLIQYYGLSGTYLFLSGFLLQCVPLAMLLRNPETPQDQKSLGSVLSRAASISIINEHRRRSVKDFTPVYDSVARFKMNNPDIPPRRSSSKIRFSIDVSNYGDSNTAKQDIPGTINEGFVYDNSSKSDLKSLAEDNEKNEKENTDVNQIIQHPSIARLKSRLGRENEGFNYEDSPKSVRSRQSVPSHQSVRSPQSIRSILSVRSQQSVRSEQSIRSQPSVQSNLSNMEAYNPVIKFKYTDDQEQILKTDPKLMSFKRIESSSYININIQTKNNDSEIVYTEDCENRDSFSSEFLPTFVNRLRSNETVDGESFYEGSLKMNRKTSAILGNALMRRASVLSKPELSISKSLNIFLEPIFLIVLFSNAVYTFCFIAFITVVVDFTTDIGLSDSDGKFVIMAFSVASNIGLLSFGWVTDGSYLSLTNFAALMLFLRTITLCLIPYSDSFIMLMSVVSVQGFVEASLANMFPLIVAESYTDEIHELALSCTLFLSGPMFMGTPLLIGFFRDDLGSYVYLFLLMAALSFICSILNLFAPVLGKCRCGRDDWILRKL